VAVPQYHELLNPTLRALRSLGGSATIAELDEEATRSLNLSEEDLVVPHGDRGSKSELEYRFAWARTYLKAYGLLQNSQRGVWSLTPVGKDTDHIDPDTVVRFVRQKTESRPRRAARAVLSSQVPETVALAEAELGTVWRERLLSILQSLPPATFERLCQRVLRESGFVQVKVTGKSGDGGIDGVGIVRIGGLLGFPVLFQCKRYAGSVSASTIRDFRGAMIGRADRGLVMTTGTFSRDAKAEATRDGAPPIDLVDGEELLDKLKELRLGVVVRTIEEVSVDEQWFESV
jgi:restriction system protein